MLQSVKRRNGFTFKLQGLQETPSREWALVPSDPQHGWCTLHKVRERRWLPPAEAAVTEFQPGPWAIWDVQSGSCQPVACLELGGNVSPLDIWQVAPSQRLVNATENQKQLKTRNNTLILRHFLGSRLFHVCCFHKINAWTEISDGRNGRNVNERYRHRTQSASLQWKFSPVLVKNRTWTQSIPAVTMLIRRPFSCVVSLAFG